MIPACTAKEDIGGKLDPAFETNKILVELGDIFSVNLNIFRDCLPEIRMLDQAQAIIGPKNTALL